MQEYISWLFPRVKGKELVFLIVNFFVIFSDNFFLFLCKLIILKLGLISIINFKEYRSAKQTNLSDMGTAWMVMLFGLIEEGFFTKAYWIGNRSWWSFSSRLTTNNLHSPWDFRFFSVATLFLDKSSLATAPLSIKNSSFVGFFWDFYQRIQNTNENY